MLPFFIPVLCQGVDNLEFALIFLLKIGKVALAFISRADTFVPDRF